MDGEEVVEQSFLTALSLLEQAHRRLHDVVKDNLERSGERSLTGVQALLIYEIGDEETPASTLRARGAFAGTSMSYNVKKLQDAGYLIQTRSDDDRRTVLLKLTPSGKAVREKDSMLRDFKEELASELRMRRAEADAHKHEMRKLDVLHDNFAKVTSEKDLLGQQLDKAHSDLVELNVKAAELEHMATKGEAAVKERDECKAECDELKDSNSRMGQRVAEMASRNSILEQENGEQKSTVQQQRHDF